MRRLVGALGGVVLVGLGVVPGWAGTVAPLRVISAGSPFAPGCEVTPQPNSTNYQNAEVEPWVEVNPTDSRNMIAVWQQDRWSNGGAHGLVTVFTKDGGAAWATRTPHFSRCAGGTAANGGDYDRASDPWVTFAPNGDAYQISLSVNLFENFVTECLEFKNSDGGTQNEVNLSLIRSTDKGATWSHGQPIRAAKEIFQGALDPDTGRPIRAEGVIADVAVNRTNGHLYAVWQDLRFRGVDEVAFVMSTDGGDTWSTPIRVNQTPPNSTNPLNQQAFVPVVHVADDGTIGVTYYDFRFNDANPGARTDFWIVRCKPSGAKTCARAADWTDESRLTLASFDIEQAPAARGPFGFFVGDYEGLTNVGNDLVPVFVQVNNGDTANRTDVIETTVGP